MAENIDPNGKQTWALVDTGCGKTFVNRAWGPITPDVLTIKCIHEDVCEYLDLDKEEGLWVLPQLDFPVLLG